MPDDGAAMSALVHWSDWAQQPDIRIACDQSYTTPKWGPRSGLTDVANVYEADDGRLYTFTGGMREGLATCPRCRDLAADTLEREGKGT